MKHIYRIMFVSFIFLGSTLPSLSQNRNNEDGVVKVDANACRFAFKPGEVLVKFKSTSPVSVTSAKGRFRAASIDKVNTLLQEFGAEEMTKLLPNENPKRTLRKAKAYGGGEVDEVDMSQVYFIKIKSQRMDTIQIFVNKLKALDEVEYVEPNYIYTVDNLQPVGPVLTAEDVAKLQTNNSNKTSFTPNDPLYSQQGYIQAVKADSVWQQTQGDTTQVIAILDTGVDWNHPDLKNKIWTNPNPATGWNMDGILNDIHGWDFVNNDNNPMDDNSHGTHVAGIAAAETNNGIGIAGVCPKAKIMPIKVFTSKGSADAATIIKGVNYATTHGATVINMSFGSYSRSIALEGALTNAYTKALLLVAAAGNDNYDINAVDARGYSLALYPAALSYVFGVQSDGGYSNYDPDGPIYSEFSEGMNYELKAPGSAISTTPNGNYRTFQGTSMAAPIVSGSVALYRSLFPNKSLEELWSDFIHSSTGIINLNNAFFNTKKIPQLDMMSFTMNDQNDGNDKDNKADAGETVNLSLKIRNTGSPADKVYAKIKVANDGNPDDIIIIKDSVSFGSIGIYRTMVNDTIPFKIKLSKNCTNNSNASIDVLMYNNADTTIVKQNVKFKIYNGQELSGILLRDTTLTPDKNWVITNSLRISTGVTVTILPGTNVEILAGVDNRGKVIAIGTPEKRVNLKGFFGGNATYKYANIDAKGGGFNASYLDNCEISNIGDLNAIKISNTIISNGSNYTEVYCDTIMNSYIDNIRFCNVNNKIINLINSTVVNCSFYIQEDFKGLIENCVISKLKNWYLLDAPGSYYSNNLKVFFIDNFSGRDNIKSNTFLDNLEGTFFLRTGGPSDLATLSGQYWGTTDLKKISSKYFDFRQNAGLPYFNFEPKLIAPSDSCPGHVWKVLVNGKDAQDEVVEPVGVGKQRFDVYFNRAMNKDSIPQVTFGGIYPYTSNKINEDGKWSDDGKIYTVYKTIKLTTGDGINQIRVAGAKQAGDWGWKIPVEDSRFSFTISAANSASLDFMATAGLGKVKLEWNNNDLEDGLGYNMYRMEQINDSTLSKPVMINSTLITDTLYTDYSVTPNKKYFYYYKIMRTNLAETDSSKVVSAIPFTATKGDANGSMSVDVADVVSVVNYALGQKPEPFIFEAADVNGDKSIDILDVIGIIKIILNPNEAKEMSIESTARYTVEDGILYVESPVDLSGVQVRLNVPDSHQITSESDLDGFENASAWLDSQNYLFLAYSMNGKTLSAGKHALLNIGDASISQIALSDSRGVNVLAINGDATGIKANEPLQIEHPYPNPFKTQLTIPYIIGKEGTNRVEFDFYDITGRMIDKYVTTVNSMGKYRYVWIPKQVLCQGLYFVTLRVNGTDMQTARVIYEK